MKRRHVQQSDEAIADLLMAVARQYRLLLRTGGKDPRTARLEIVRKLELIGQSIRGLMKPRQRELFLETGDLSQETGIPADEAPPAERVARKDQRRR